jgi:hypothetical protein
MVEVDITDKLHGDTVHDYRIPDDNHEATILGVGEPDRLTFDFEEVEYYGAGDLGIPFTCWVECTLNYSIFKSDYFTMGEEETKDISIEELNKHYFDAEQDFILEVAGVLSLSLAKERLQSANLTDDDIDGLINDADHDVEILETAIAGEETE